MSDDDSTKLTDRPIAGFLRKALGKSDEEIQQLIEGSVEPLAPPETEALPEDVGQEEFQGVVQILEDQEKAAVEDSDNHQETMTETAQLKTIEEQIEQLEGKSEEIEDTLDQEIGELGIELIDEDVPIISVNDVPMMPMEKVGMWLNYLDGRIDRLAEIAQQREEERQKIQQELYVLEKATENASSSNWIECKVDKAYTSQDKLINDGNYCSLDPSFAGDIDVSEDEKLTVRRADEPEKAAVYKVHEIRQQGGAKFRISNKGRKRLDCKSTFEAEITKT